MRAQLIIPPWALLIMFAASALGTIMLFAQLNDIGWKILSR